MVPRKYPRTNRRRAYRFFTEIGLALTLLLMILAFRFHLEPDPQRLYMVDPPYDVFCFEEMPQTVQSWKPPPPPHPRIIHLIPDDAILDAGPLDLDNPIDIDTPTPLDLPPEPDEIKEEDGFFQACLFEQMPELIGDLGEIQKKIRYPEVALKAGVEGRVIIQFIVDESGNVSEPAVVRGIGAGCDEEALRVVRQARFTPGMQRGKAVKVKMSLPITFKLK